MLYCLRPNTVQERIQRIAAKGHYRMSPAMVNALAVLEVKDRTVEALATILALTTHWQGRDAEVLRSELKQRLMTYHG